MAEWMSNYARIKALQIGKRKSFRILAGAELVLLILGVIGLFGKDAVYEYGIDGMQVFFGAYSEEHGGIAADSSVGTEGYMAMFPGIALPPGVYRVRLRYSTDTDWVHRCEVLGEGEDLRTNGAELFSGLDSTDFTMWLPRGSSDAALYVYYGGAGTLAVQRMDILQTNAGNRIALFVMVIAFALIDAGYLYLQYDRAYSVPAEKKTVLFCLGLTVFVASVPLMVDYTVGSGDLVYHLMRVEGIKDGILSGQFPVRISPEWQQGYGYASPIFYGETLLYLAGLLRLIGFTVLTSYRIFLFAVTVATVLTAYFCFKKIFRNPYIGVFCSMLYSVSIYRIFVTYIPSRLGEVFGILLLPLIVSGFWRVFTQDIREESYKRSWVPLAIGFSLLVQSHLLTCEMAGFFAMLLCIVLWKRVFRIQTFTVLVKTVSGSILLSAWFLVPFVDYMLTGDFVIQHVSARTIQNRGLYPAHLLFTYFINGFTLYVEETGMVNASAMGVGIVLTAGLAVLAYLWFDGRLGRMEREMRALGGIAGWSAVLAMSMSLILFPWDRMQAINGIAAVLVSSVQFPSRFLIIANVCLTLAAGVAAKCILDRKSRLAAAGYFGGMLFLLFLGNIYYMDHIMNTHAGVRIYNSEGMGTRYISGAEYLPYGADASRFVYHTPAVSEGLVAGDYKKQPLGAECYIENIGETDGKATFALLYYKGYHAYDMDSGKELACYAGENFEVTVGIPADFSGRVKVKFVSPWYWRAGEIVTLVTGIAMIYFFCWRYRGGKTGRSVRGGRE